MDEETLEAAISTYGAQLQQVETAISAGLDPSQQSDLLQLKEDLLQLIELTEASLVSVKKSQLLASLEDSNELPSSISASAADTIPSNDGLNAEFAAFYGELGESSCSSSDNRDRNVVEGQGGDNSEEEEEDALSGTKVRAPYRTAWGTLEYHNAMVVGAEPPEGEETQVRVFYIYPTQKSMKPCPFYLEGKCRFLESCRFSHGEVVYVSELREFLHFDLSKLKEGSSCLARHDDGIWYPAKITEINSGLYTLKFDSLLLKDTAVEADGIIPPLREHLLSSESDSDEPTDGGDVTNARDSAEEFTVTLDFGGWETHTKGIGSKLMLKMGYEYGKGLGKMQEGRVEPVMAVVLPKGRSLDQCAELAQSKAAKKGTQAGCPKKRRKRRAAPREHCTVFDFLNNKLGGQSTDPAEGGAAVSSVATSGEAAYKGGKSTKRSLNVKLFQASERVSQTEREIQKLTELLSRQPGRDTSRARQLEEKLSAAHHLLARLKAQEMSLQREHKKADTHKKMTEF